MPNWCSNSVEIVGSLEEVVKVVHSISVAGEDEEAPRRLSFEALLPTPETKYEEWQSWRIAAWGTKWDLSDTEGFIDVAYDKVSDLATATASFDTAWSPPVPFFETVSSINRGVSIMLEFDEFGADFWGKATLRGGRLVDLKEGPSKMNEELEEMYGEDEA